MNIAFIGAGVLPIPAVKSDKVYLKLYQLLLENYNNQMLNKGNSKHINLTSLEKIIIDKIKDKGITLDELVMTLQQDKSNILKTVSVMKLEGKIINVGVLKSCC